MDFLPKLLENLWYVFGFSLNRIPSKCTVGNCFKKYGNNFLGIIREKLVTDFYQQEKNYDNLGKNVSNRFLKSTFYNFLFCGCKFETMTSNSTITYNLAKKISNKIKKSSKFGQNPMFLISVFRYLLIFFISRKDTGQ